MDFKEPIIHLLQFMRQKISEFGVDGSSKGGIIGARYTESIEFTKTECRHANWMDFSLINFSLVKSHSYLSKNRFQAFVVDIVIRPLCIVAGTKRKLFPELHDVSIFPPSQVALWDYLHGDRAGKVKGSRVDCTVGVMESIDVTVISSSEVDVHVDWLATSPKWVNGK